MPPGGTRGPLRRLLDPPLSRSRTIFWGPSARTSHPPGRHRVLNRHLHVAHDLPFSNARDNLSDSLSGSHGYAGTTPDTDSSETIGPTPCVLSPGSGPRSSTTSTGSSGTSLAPGLCPPDPSDATPPARCTPPRRTKAASDSRASSHNWSDPQTDTVAAPRSGSPFLHGHSTDPHTKVEPASARTKDSSPRTGDCPPGAEPRPCPRPCGNGPNYSGSDTRSP